MDIDSIISNLEREWDLERGCFGPLRNGEFDAESFDRLIATLDGINLGHEMAIKRRLISLLWFMPLFMQWQRERLREAGGDLERFDEAAKRIENAVIHLLGVP